MGDAATATDTLTWNLQFNLAGDGLGLAESGLNNLAGSLQKGQRAITEYEQNGRKLKVTIEDIGKSAEKAKGPLESLVSHYQHVKSAVMDVIEVLKKPLEMLDEFGNKAVEAFTERSGTLRTWTALLGDAKQATEEFGRTQRLALRTPFLSSNIEQAKTQLMGQDIRNEGGQAGGTLDKTLLALTDLASRHHDRNQALQRGTYAVDEILSQGYLSAMRARQLSIDLMLPQRKMAEALNMTPEEFHHALKKKTITNERFLPMLHRAAMLHTKESALGETSTAGAGGLGTLLTNQQEQVKNLLKTFDSELLPGVRRYKQALQDQGDAYSLSSKSGNELVLTFQDFANTSTSLKASWTEFVTGFTSSFAESYNEAMRVLGVDQGGLDGLSDSARALGTALGKVGTVVATLNRVLDHLSLFVGGAAYWIEYFGGVIKTFGELIAKLWTESVQQFSFAVAKPGFDVAAAFGPERYKPGFDFAADAQQQKREADNIPAKLRRPEEHAAGGHGGAGHGSGRGGGIGGAPVGDFRPDYSGLLGGLEFPQIVIPGGAEQMGLAPPQVDPLRVDQLHLELPEVAPPRAAELLHLEGAAAQEGEVRRGLQAQAEEQRQAIEQTIENVQIVINGADTSKEEIAQKVAELLRGLSRYTRTPAPSRM